MLKKAGGCAVEGLVALTGVTGPDVVSHIIALVWPPEVSGDSLKQLVHAQVSREGCVMVLAENVLAKVSASWHVDCAVLAPDAMQFFKHLPSTLIQEGVAFIA